MKRCTWVVTALLVGTFCGAARAQQDVTVVRMTDEVLRQECKKIGMNLGGGANYMKVKGVFNFEGIIRRHVSFGPLAGDGRITDWWNAPDDWDPTGWNYRILTGESYGISGEVLGRDTERYIHEGKPEMKFRMLIDKKFPMIPHDAWVVEKETDTGWIGVESVVPLHYAMDGDVKTSYETVDLSPDTPGKVCLRVKTGPNSFRDVMCKLYTSHVDATGKWRISFRAKSLKPDCAITVRVDTASQELPLTQEWKDYVVELVEPPKADRRGMVPMGIQVGENSEVLLDDMVFEKLVEHDNPTVFRDAVLRALRMLQGEGGRPGALRYWAGQLGDSVDNQFRGRLERKAHTRSRARLATPDRNGGAGGSSQYALHEFLELCKEVNMEPWYCTPGGIGDQDVQNLMEYFGGDETTTYGSIRIERGQKEPWTEVFPTIHLEIGNEAWNAIFHGGGIPLSYKYAENVDRVAAAVKASPYYKEGKLKFHVGIQAGNTWAWGDTFANINNATSVAAAPYLMHNADTGPPLYRQALAATEQWTTTSSFGNMVAVMKQKNPRLEPSIYEVNYHITGKNDVPQKVKNELVAGVGGAVNMANYMMLCKKRLGVQDLCFFSLYQHGYRDSNGHIIKLWGTTCDMQDGSERKRPTFLALVLLNRAIRGDMLETEQTGADPHWDYKGVEKSKARVNDLEDLPYVYSYAFRSQEERSVVLINTHPDEAQSVSLSVGKVPAEATAWLLTSGNITDWNEESEVVKIGERAIEDFRDGYAVELPPFSLKVLRWERVD